jgi:hypothetical protein
MKIRNLSKRASILLAVLVSVSGVIGGISAVLIHSFLVQTYSAGTVIASLPSNVTINAPLNWGTVTQG